MLDNVIKDEEFALMMQRHIEEMIGYMFEKEQYFSILCKIEDVSFEPELPEDIHSQFRSLTIFLIAEYTFESARIIEDKLVFEAGFGKENVGSFVSVPLLSIMQIIIDNNNPILINLATYKQLKRINKKVDENGVQNSMNSFLSNPENSKFLKK